MTTWYWYLSGAFTVLFIQSVLLNFALMNGWLKISRQDNKIQVMQPYDQDRSRELLRVQ